MAVRPIFTIGHSKRPVDEFVALLQQSSVDLVVDVRAFPRSRTNPQFNEDSLPQSLAGAGMRYVHLGKLGGRRRASRAPSRNTLWRHSAFRNYADYAGGPEFRAGLEQLLTLAERHTCALMCAEALWWRCHRRIIADYLLAREIAVAHIMGPGKVTDAQLTPGARIAVDGTVSYFGSAPESPSI